MSFPGPVPAMLLRVKLVYWNAVKGGYVRTPTPSRNIFKCDWHNGSRTDQIAPKPRPLLSSKFFGAFYFQPVNQVWPKTTWAEIDSYIRRFTSGQLAGNQGQVSSLIVTPA